LFLKSSAEAKSGPDARATTDIAGFFNLNQAPRVFTTIPARLDANYFLNDPRPPSDPDDY
jgi:hypothetical protein